MRTVVLTDENGTAVGSAGLLDAHTGSGQLHRAFSVFVLRNQGTELLLQRRSADKLLFAGLWANTCCSHPYEDEDVCSAGQRRLQEELGFTCPLQTVGSFVYRAEDPNGHGTEYEHDTVLVGEFPAHTEVQADPSEIAEWQWVSVSELSSDIARQPELYAPWLPLALKLLTEASEAVKQ